MSNADIIRFIRELFGEPEKFIPLHEPRFVGNDKAYVTEAIDSTFVSSVGAYVDRFEKELAAKVGSKYAVVTVNGTAALHIAMLLAGVKRDEEVLTQPLTFVATANAISYIGAKHVFVDVEKERLGMSPDKLAEFLQQHAEVKNDGLCYNKTTGRRIAACVPMHTFGFPLRIDEIMAVCEEYNIPVVEDAAESIGSYYKGKSTGTYGLLGALSFNGNKIITCGGGGAIITDDEQLAKRAKHITTTAKVPHPWEYVHDEVGYNYRMPNLNAALACAQLEMLDDFIAKKRELTREYEAFFKNSPYRLVTEASGSTANYWLNTLIVNSKEEKETLLKETNDAGVMTRPAWGLMNRLPMFADSFYGNLENAEWLEERIVNLPSSVRLNR